MARLVEVAPVKTALVEKRFVEVAFVLVAFQSERLVTVLEALLTRMPPVSVARPVTESVPVAVIVPPKNEEPET